MAKIDILLTYWGDSSLFIKTVESVLAQTNSDWNLLIFDDAYPDDAAERYITNLKDPRIAYYRHKNNIGITRNFNYALERARSEYCVFLGCDDLMLENYIDHCLESIKDSDLLQPGVEVIDKNGNLYNPLGDRVKNMLRLKSGFYKGERIAASLSTGNWLYFPSIFWRTTTLQKYRFNERYKILEDVVLEFELLLDGASIAVSDTIVFQYRRFSESLSSQEKKKSGVRFKEEAEVYNHFSKLFKQAGWINASIAAKLRLTSRIHRLLP